MATQLKLTNVGSNISELLEIYTSVNGTTWNFIETTTKTILLSSEGYVFTPPVGTLYYQIRDTGSCGTVLQLNCIPATTTTTSTTAATTTTSTTVATTTTSTTAATTTTSTTPATTTTSTTPATTTTSTTPPTTTTTTTTGGIGTTTTTTTETHILLSPVYWAANSTDLCDGTYDVEITNLYSNDPLITTLVDGESCYVDEFGNSYDEYTFDGYVTQVLGGLSVGEFTAPSLWQETVICPTTTTTTTAATTTTTTTVATTTTTTTAATTTTTTTAATTTTTTTQLVTEFRIYNQSETTDVTIDDVQIINITISGASFPILDGDSDVTGYVTYNSFQNISVQVTSPLGSGCVTVTGTNGSSISQSISGTSQQWLSFSSVDCRSQGTGYVDITLVDTTC